MLLHKTLAVQLLLSLSSSNAILIKSNSADPGVKVWMGIGGCTGTPSPVGMVVPLVVADPFLFMGLPLKPLAAKYLTADGKNLLSSAQNFFCNATVWVPFFNGLSPTLAPVKGSWVWQSSYAYNLCGMGYATGSWKSLSAYMKTLESMGALGTTVFMATTPSRYMNCAELCDGVTIPTTVTSLVLYHLKYPGGSLVLKVLGAQRKGSKYTIDYTDADWNAGPFYTWGYIVGIICAIICAASVFLGITALKRLNNKMSFAALILGYESVASTFRIILFVGCSPIGWGYAFYNGLGTNTLNHMQTILGPLGLPTTFLTALVWAKFSFFRDASSNIINGGILLLTVALTVSLWVAALSFGFFYEAQGILAGGVTAAGDDARSLSAKIKIPFSALSLLIFILSNAAWLTKLSKVAGTSPQLAIVARRCMKIMFFQIIFLSLTLLGDGAMLTHTTPPLLDANGNLQLSIHQTIQVFVEPLSESVLGLSQVMAIRSLSSSSSSSSSSS